MALHFRKLESDLRVGNRVPIHSPARAARAQQQQQHVSAAMAEEPGPQPYMGGPPSPTPRNYNSIVRTDEYSSAATGAPQSPHTNNTNGSAYRDPGSNVHHHHNSSSSSLMSPNPRGPISSSQQQNQSGRYQEPQHRSTATRERSRYQGDQQRVVPPIPYNNYSSSSHSHVRHQDFGNSSPATGPRLDVGPRVDTGRRSQKPTHSAATGITSAMERILAEEQQKKAQQRTASPVYRSTAGRFGLESKRPDVGAPRNTDRGSFYRTLSSSSHSSMYMPPGMGDRPSNNNSRRSSPVNVNGRGSRATSPMARSTTPRFAAVMAHGGGLISPVVSARGRTPPKRSY